MLSTIYESMKENTSRLVRIEQIVTRLVNAEREIQLYTNDKQAGSDISPLSICILFFQILAKSIIHVYYKIVRVCLSFLRKAVDFS